MQLLKGFLIGMTISIFSLPLLSQNTEVVINEFMAKNTTYAQDEAGQFDDYIELRNNSATDWINLKNWTLTDTLGIPDKWQFPDDATLEPHGYMVLWADEDGGQGDLHVNFKLDGDGEELYLFDENGVMIDEIVFGEQVDDMSYSRVPNGTGNFVIKDGTIGFNNEDTSSTNNQFATSPVIYPNPTIDILTINNLDKKNTEVQLFDLIGNIILSTELGPNNNQLDLTFLNSGMYIISINGNLTDRLIKL